MKQKCLILLLLFISVAVKAEGDLYSKLAEISMLTDGFEPIRTASGMDFKSEKTFKNSKGKLEPVIHLELEGPMNAPQLDSVEKASLAVAKMINPEVDPEYKNENEMYPGLSFELVDINGTKVGFLGYKFKPEPNTYMRRAVMVTEKGVYSFAITIHLSAPENESKLLLSQFLIASINSGKL